MNCNFVMLHRAHRQFPIALLIDQPNELRILDIQQRRFPGRLERFSILNGLGALERDIWVHSLHLAYYELGIF